MRKAWLALFLLAALSPPGRAQEKTVRFELSFSGNLTFSDGVLESALFARAGRPLWHRITGEATTGIDHRRQSATLLYTAAARLNLPQSGWTPFLLLGGGGESVFVGPFLESRPVYLGGAGFLLPLRDSAFLRFDYQFQNVRGALYNYNRHTLLFGLLLQWIK